MADLGWAGMAGAGGVADAMSTLFNQRMEAAKLAQQFDEFQKEQTQQTALKRMELDSQAQLAREAAQRVQDTHNQEISRQNFAATPPDVPISQEQAQGYMTTGSIPSNLMRNTPNTYPALSSSIAGLDQPQVPEGTPIPIPGTTANSPAPGRITLQRIPSGKEAEDLQKRADEQAYVNSLPAGPQRDIAQFNMTYGRNPSAEFDPSAKPGTHVFTQEFGLTRIPADGGPATQIPGVGGIKLSPTPQYAEIQQGTADAPKVAIVPKNKPGVYDVRTPKPTPQQDADRRALNGLDQLDAAIDAAEPFIGPGPGQVTSLEQLGGMADTRAQALTAKMNAVKTEINRAISGSTRAGMSKESVKQWNDVMANKVTPAGFRAGVQALREIIAGASGVTSGATNTTTGGAGTSRTVEQIMKDAGIDTGTKK